VEAENIIVILSL